VATMRLQKLCRYRYSWQGHDASLHACRPRGRHINVIRTHDLMAWHTFDKQHNSNLLTTAETHLRMQRSTWPGCRATRGMTLWLLWPSGLE
jgi:hypothetical protein